MAKGRKTTPEEKVEIVSFCIAESRDYEKAIKRYGISYQQIYSWVRKYEEQGVEGLRDRRGKRKALSEMDEVERLRAQIRLKEAENRKLQMENNLLKKLAEMESRPQTDVANSAAFAGSQISRCFPDTAYRSGQSTPCLWHSASQCLCSTICNKKNG